MAAAVTTTQAAITRERARAAIRNSRSVFNA
jgi:hypothetical protein